MNKFFDRFKKKPSDVPPRSTTYPGGIEPSAPPAPKGMFPEYSDDASTPAVPVGKITLIGGNTSARKSGKRKTKRYIKKNKSRKIKTKKIKRRNKLYK